MRALVSIFSLSVCALAQHHPLDGLTTAEYWAVYDVLQASGNLTGDTLFASVLLRPPEKSRVLAWKPGEAMPRAADVVLLRKAQSFAAVVDLAGGKILRWEELKDAQAPFLASEVRGVDDAIKKDARVVEALNKRGITDLRMVQCAALPVAYRAIPEQATRRIGFGGCSQTRGVYHGWGRSIEGLTFQVDMVEKKVLKVVDTGVAPVPSGDTNYEEIPELPRPHTTPIATSQPMGPGFRLDRGEVQWQNWRFRFRIDPRVGLVVNLVRYADRGRERSILYEGHLSELFVPYMDPANGWNNRAFFDAGQFFADNGGFLKPVQAGIDCPAHAEFFDGIVPGESGSPKLRSHMACLFERHPESPAWRHGQGAEVYGRPNRQLVLRSAAVVGNYDYLLDWRFDPDGTIEVAVGATGVIETRSTVQKDAGEHGHADYGQLVAEHTLGVHHDHFFAYRLDLDVEGTANSFVKHTMVPQRLENDPMRRSIWVTQHTVAKREREAISDIRLDQPSMWMFVNPAVKGPLNYPVGYEVMPGATAKSLLSPDDPTQTLGAFSAHQFWVTPYSPEERYASGTYPTSSAANDGLAVWTQANRPIENTDIVGWYTLGFHHIPRAEDWPVMPVMWHAFHLRPFHFFPANPVLDLQKSLSRP
jgi:primary-amine oxidase